MDCPGKYQTQGDLLSNELHTVEIFFHRDARKCYLLTIFETDNNSQTVHPDGHAALSFGQTVPGINVSEQDEGITQ
jgi:hypothetical protein